ncbi:ECF RNA polymerase sigma factor SigK [Kitasatospora sp. NPDC059827]|uniref:ECF RNA polymerase sigma factor SigK n=1 Tax=Kitasatospora sp. NPDC059827 TaxID=3346964 RepID=UPI003655D8E4
MTERPPTARPAGPAVPAVPERTADGRARLRVLMAGTARGDERAFEELYAATAGAVLGLVLRVVRDRAQAEEVVQEAFWQVWREAPRYRPERGEVLTWMLTVAHHRAVDRVRSARAAADRDRAAALRGYTPEFDQVAEQVEGALDRELERRSVRHALAGLTEVQRECLLLVYFGGCTHTQAAAVLGAPLGTVKTRIRDALGRLREELGASAGPPPRPRARRPTGPRRPVVGSRP